MSILSNHSANVINFANDFLFRENKRFLDPLDKTIITYNQPSYACVFAKTQVGKTNAICILIQKSLSCNSLVFVMSDNKIDQQAQLFERVSNYLSENEIICKVLKITDKDYQNDLVECIESKIPVITFCLNNYSQLANIENNLIYCAAHLASLFIYRNIVMICDEADVAIQDPETEIITSSMTVSHKNWIELSSFVSKEIECVDLKRIFVTSTPDCCLLLYNIPSQYFLHLTESESYSGYNEISFKNFENEDSVFSMLDDEVKRIQRSKPEIILYVVERIKNGDCSHNNVFLNLIKRYPGININIYNGDGITVYSKNPKFVKALKTFKVEYTTLSNNTYLLKKSTLIADFYSYCNISGESVIITIGKDLITRGISYVSKNIFFYNSPPIFATTMFYKPGKTLHQAALNQCIGRLTGNVGKNVIRTLYTQKDVYDSYISYNRNQDLYVKNIKEANLDISTCDTLNYTSFVNYSTRTLERPKLKLKLNIQKESTFVEGEIDGVNLTLLKKWYKENSLVGKMIRFKVLKYQNKTLKTVLIMISLLKNLFTIYGEEDL